MRPGFLSLLILMIAAALVPACSKSDRYGSPIGDTPPTDAGRILSNPGAYTNQPIVVKGRIVTECPTGCWFELKDGEAVLYVDIGPQGLAIPQRVGRPVTVEGRISVEGRRVRLNGTGVEVR